MNRSRFGLRLELEGCPCSLGNKSIEMFLLQMTVIQEALATTFLYCTKDSDPDQHFRDHVIYQIICAHERHHLYTCSVLHNFCFFSTTYYHFMSM
jgi:hypothetical protein